MLRQACLISAAMLLLGNAEAEPIPAPLKAMLGAAMANGSESEVATVAKYAKKAAPGSVDEISAQVEGWRKALHEKREEAVRSAGLLQLWKGKAELGGFASTGNTDAVGVSASLDLAREGLHWRHKLRASLDYQRTDGLVSRERYVASYEPNYKLDDRLYAYGAAQYESDRILGYTDRVSLSAGVGYRVLQGSGVTLALDAGPAYRATSFTDGTDESALAGRGSLDFDWRLKPGLKLSQSASVYAQSSNSTISSTSALSAKLIGPLSAQLSYNVQYESQPPIGRVGTDTISRASLVYEF